MESRIYSSLVNYIPESCGHHQILARVRSLQDAKIFYLELMGRFKKERLFKPECKLEQTTLISDPKNAEGSSFLTPREFEVFKLMAKGLQNKQIPDRLSIADGTVHNHITNIYSKLNARNRIEAIIKGLRLEFITIDEFLGLEE